MNTLGEFADWRRHPITQVVLTELQSRYNRIKEELVEQASSISHEELCEKAGAAKAYRDVLNIALDDIEESNGS